MEKVVLKQVKLYSPITLRNLPTSVYVNYLETPRKQDLDPLAILLINLSNHTIDQLQKLRIEYIIYLRLGVPIHTVY